MLCLDVGEKRVGLAISDPAGWMATPLGFIERTRLQVDIARILQYAQVRGAEGIVVGMPLLKNRRVGLQAQRVAAFVKALQRKTELPVETLDESFSTAEAERLLREVGGKPSRRKGDVDAAAAAVILQEYLDGARDRAGVE